MELESFIDRLSKDVLRSLKRLASEKKLKQNRIFVFTNSRLFLSFYPNVREYHAALYLSDLFINNGILCPKPVLAIKHYRVIFYEYVYGQLIAELKFGLNKTLESALEICQKLHKLNVDSKYLALGPMTKSSFFRILDSVVRISNAAGLKFNRKSLSKECSNILDRVFKKGRKFSFIHHDFQGRNLIKTKKGIYITDFERARIGLPEWDISALIFSSSLKWSFDRKLNFLCEICSRLKLNYEDVILVSFLRLLRGVERRLQVLENPDKQYFVQSFKSTLIQIGELSRVLGLENFENFCKELINYQS